jgi:paraquat-inducible protein A
MSLVLPLPADAADPAPAADIGVGLIACPVCDMLHSAAEVPPGGRLRCQRCRKVLMTNRPRALDRLLAVSLASAILIVAAVFYPFIGLSVAGLHREASVLDAALAYSSGLMVPLALATAALIVVIPILRALFIAWTVLPLRLDRPPLPGARAAFRLAGQLKPWSMAEVFIIGVVVALVKVAGIATLDLGPAFWAMAALVLTVVLEGATLCEWSIWQTLERMERS